jgi:short-subunit dehydrogenase
MFKNKIVIITGAASGLGQALAIAMADRGAVMVLADVDQAKLIAVEQAIQTKGQQVQSHFVDVSQYGQMQKLIMDTLTKHGRIDYLFNNAGRGIAGKCQDFSIEDWQTILNINLNGVVYGCELAYKIMVKQGFGHIINTASLAALMPFPSALPYTTSKSAVLGLSRSLRIEGQFYGVKVSALCPGFVQTQIYENAIREVSTNHILSSIPLPIITLDKAVNMILKGVANNKGVIAFPFYTKVSWWFARHFYPISAWFSARNFQQFTR